MAARRSKQAGAFVIVDDEAQSVLYELGAKLGLDEEVVDEVVWVGQYRAQLHEFRNFSGRAEAMASIEHRAATCEGWPLKLRIYSPIQITNDAALLYFHGGGFIGGSLDTHDRLARSLATAAGCKLVSVDYPLAPEAPFPGAVETCYSAFRWLHSNAAQLGVDANRLIVTGDSAGGLLAVVVALLCRDRGIEGPALQMPLYPNVDVRLGRDYPSMHEFDGTIVKLDELERGLLHYLPDAGDRDELRATPLAATSFAGVAPAWVLTCECDPLRDEGRLLAARLEAAGVPTVHREAMGMPHAFLQMAGKVQMARTIFGEIGSLVAGIAAA